MDCLAGQSLKKCWCRPCKARYARDARSCSPGNTFERDRYRRTKNSNLQIAKRAVYCAVRAGRIPRAKTLKCVDCNDQASCYDHRDYLKPLEVVPVCTGCNKRRGKGLNV